MRRPPRAPRAPRAPQPPKDLWYFAYGSNMDPEQMRERGRWLQGEPFDFSSVTLSDLADEVEDNA